MLRILVVVPTPFVFGLQNATLGFFKELDKTRLSALFLVSHWNDGKFIDRLNDLGLPYEVSYLGFLSKQIRWSTIKMTLDCMIHIPKLFFDLWRLMRRHHFDLIYVSGYHNLIQLFPMLLWWRKPVVCHVHDYYLDSRFYKFLWALLDRRITRYVAVSDAVRLRLELLGIPQEKIQRIYNGIDVASFDIGKPYKDIFRKRHGWSSITKVVALVGQIAPHKGTREYLEAARIVCEQRGDIRFLIVGHAIGEHFEQVRKRVVELGLEDQIVFCGFEKNTVDLFTSIDILVVPSQLEEPFGLVAIEAMAAGKPVIVSRSGGLVEIVEDGRQGFVIEKKDVQGIAKTILILANDSELATKMGKAARRKVEEMFSIERQAALLEDCFRQVCYEQPHQQHSRAEV